MQSVDEVCEAALNLPILDREVLVSHLLESLQVDSPEVSEDDDWTRELLRRSDAFRSGEEPARDWREAVADIRRQFQNGCEP
jgi:putative addiction module component (TIGR02574 family)